MRGAAGNTHVGEEDAALAMAQILPGDSLPPELGALAARLVPLLKNALGTLGNFWPTSNNLVLLFNKCVRPLFWT